MFEDEKNPDAPIVIHFSLVNISFKEYKAPGKSTLFTCIRKKLVSFVFIAFVIHCDCHKKLWFVEDLDSLSTSLPNCL